MKNILLPAVIILFTFVGIVQAEQIQTKFAAPLQNLNLDTNAWSVFYKDNSIMLFNLKEDLDVQFLVLQGLPLKTASHAELVKQLSIAKVAVKEIPLLTASFPFIGDGETILRIENWTEVVVNGKEGIKIYEVFDEEDAIVVEDEELSYSETKAVAYLFLLGNRIYAICFSTPAEKFSDLEPFFEETIQHLW